MKTIHAALAGNPNVGKSTVFNALTGLRQHTGNWAGKTVECARGVFEMRTNGENTRVELTDLPGIYSLNCRSAEEEAARDHLVTARPDVTICVCDACSLERGLILCLQVRDLGSPVILAVNLMDEAEKKGIRVDCGKLSELLGCPVVPAAARRGEGLDELKKAVYESCTAQEKGTVNSGTTASGIQTAAVSHTDCESAKISALQAPEVYASLAAELAAACVTSAPSPDRCDRRIDRIVCGKYTSVLVMLALLLLVFWLTLVGTNAISDKLEHILDALLGWMRSGCARIFPAI